MLSFRKICIFMVIRFLEVLSEHHKEDQFMLNFQQNDYQINVERIELVSYNRDYAQNAKLVTFKYNRTCTAFNASATFKVDFGNQLEVVAQGYKFASNEYRLFPMRFQLNVCDALSKNIAGTAAAIRKCGNFTGCPLMKGHYEICNSTPDPSKFPPFIPTGRYMVEMQALYLSKEIALARGYCEVTRPFTGK